MNKKLSMAGLNRPSAEEAKLAQKIPVVVILDNVRSFHNVGSVFRSADAFSVGKILLCGFTPAPPHREIHKTALGATETVHWEKHDDTLVIIQMLKKLGYIIVAVEQAEKTVLLNELKIETDKKYALVFGHEVDGVQQEVIDECDMVIEIPQRGSKHSLNVSVCAGVVIWEFFKFLKA
ncbi:MAG: RNA methyltransferase [Flavobacteriales bacterium]